MGKMFTSSAVVQAIIWNARFADYDRSTNRAQILSLFNGNPPYSAADVADSLGVSNVNDLSAPTLGHEARRNFANAFQKPGKFFTVALDSGSMHKRQEWGQTITNEINRILKKSKLYFETLRSTFASLVLYGIGPAVWVDSERWCPRAFGVGDVLIPSGTLLDMENLPYFSTYYRYTANQIRKMTSGPNRDPGWNMDAVNKQLKWADAETASGPVGNQFPEVFQPERMEERFKEDGGQWGVDAVPTIDTYDFRYWSEEGGKAGWRRRLVLDPWGCAPGSGGTGGINPVRKNVDSDFLFNSGDRTYGEKLESLIHFQFADLSAFGPFRYHSVRSLGFLLFSVCHINNRLWCKTLDSTFEALMQYFRVNSDEEVARALKVNLVDKGFIDRSVQFVPQAERWQVNERLVEMTMGMCAEKMGKNANSLVEQSPGNVDHMKATVYTGEMQRANALVSAALEQAYTYQAFQYREIARRFCIPNSSDPDVKVFRVRCLKAGVPEDLLDVECWDIEPERVMGGGNQMLEQQIAQQLMGYRPFLDPDSQRTVLRKSILALSGDPDLAEQLVPPQEQRVTNTVADTQRACGALFLGMHVDPRPGENTAQVAKTVLGELALKVQQLSQAMPTPMDIAGLQNMMSFAGGQIQQLSQDPTAQPVVKELSQDLTKLGQVIQKMAQAVQKAQEQSAQAGQQNGDPEQAKVAAQVQGTIIKAKAAAEAKRESHAQSTANKATQAEIKMKQTAEKNAQDLAHQQQKHEQDLQEQRNQSALDIATQAAEANLELEKEHSKARIQKEKPAGDKAPG